MGYAITETERKLRKALEFYADPTHHERIIYAREDDTFESAVERDGGYLAQTELTELAKGERWTVNIV